MDPVVDPIVDPVVDPIIVPDPVVDPVVDPIVDPDEDSVIFFEDSEITWATYGVCDFKGDLCNFECDDRCSWSWPTVDLTQ